MQEEKYITILSNKKKIVLNISTILYVLMVGKIAEIHVSGGKIYETRMTFSELSEKLGDGFIKAHRGCLVSPMAIHDITDKINLSNGESLIYTIRKKSEIIDQFREKQKHIINSFIEDDIPATEEEYRRHYSGFEYLPFAFTDIEMVFDEERHAVDWIFRYGNLHWQNWKSYPLRSSLAVPLAACFPIWIPNGFEATNGQPFTVKSWRLLITVRRSIPI